MYTGVIGCVFGNKERIHRTLQQRTVLIFLFIIFKAHEVRMFMNICGNRKTVKTKTEIDKDLT